MNYLLIFVAEIRGVINEKRMMIFASLLTTTGLIILTRASPVSFTTYRKRDVPIEDTQMDEESINRFRLEPERLLLYDQKGLPVKIYMNKFFFFHNLKSHSGAGFEQNEKCMKTFSKNAFLFKIRRNCWEFVIFFTILGKFKQNEIFYENSFKICIF